MESEKILTVLKLISRKVKMIELINSSIEYEIFWNNLWELEIKDNVIYDFTNADQGKFYRPKSTFNRIINSKTKDTFEIKIAKEYAQLLKLMSELIEDYDMNLLNINKLWVTIDGFEDINSRYLTFK